MSSKNNVIEEIQELIQKIKNEYQEGVDFEIPYYSEKHKTGAISHLSPRLKSFLRKKFDFPSGVNDYLDYSKTNSANNYYYRLDGEHGKGEHEGLYWRLTNRGLEHEKPKKCKNCGEMTFEENGRMLLWNEKTIGKEFGQDSKVIAYFHPECAKKYFAGKEPSNENNVRIKEKLLRNLDKLCLDPDGYLANNEYLKTDEAEEEYQKTFNLPYQREWKNRYLKITIEGEEIDLYDFDNASSEYYEVKRELVKKIKQEIEQNPSEWKIERGKNENYADKNLNQLVKHQPSGRRYWKLAINHYWGGGKNEIVKYWAEIEALINGSPLPVDNNKKMNDHEQEWLKNIFQKYHIAKITFENDTLSIDYNQEINSVEQAKINDKLFQKIREYFQAHNQKEITRESLNINSDNTANSDNRNKYLWLFGGIGAGVVIALGLVFYFRSKKRKNNQWT
ncbi:protein of unknown function [endosymbiont DhMRE of Dentiscutata heterogama]|uniref:hypothetical protein n=1 Tax=endosymbiont DhMRE of Dentiscutata heterogama TaxID=1609546 RepID=UPI000629D4D1|nr:hypothetical protein [endosymbiont DhMRE of Dentiscutata heterogama]CFW93445.1 protein of unknown function [endosymbiont DhMRE of Dentiscutata heterogama]